MRLYEVVYILDPALLEDAVTAKLEKFHALATSQGIDPMSTEPWDPAAFESVIDRIITW